MLDPRRLTAAATALIAHPETEVLVSAASGWEIATKVRLGKLPWAAEFEQNFVGFVTDAGYKLVAIKIEVALRAGRITGDHRDPFDRMIAALALAEDMPLISSDAQLDTFGVRRIW